MIGHPSDEDDKKFSEYDGGLKIDPGNNLE